MPDGHVRADVVVTKVGRQALDILKTGGVGRVAALFERSFYIAFGRDWICLGADTLAMGPLNVRLSAPEDVIWETSGLQIDERVVSSAGRVRVGQAIEFDLGRAISWDPPALPPWTVQTAKLGLNGLDGLVEPGTDAGLAGYVMADHTHIPHDRVVAAASQPIEILSRAVEGAFRDIPTDPSEIERAVIALLGLGPGLTPSGDDFLGGMLIALDIWPAMPLRAQIRALVERHTQQRTNAISIAHLRAAGAGVGHEALHNILNSILDGDAAALPIQLTAIDNIGHSSGWDALAGMCVTVRAYLASQPYVVDAAIGYHSQNFGGE